MSLEILVEGKYISVHAPNQFFMPIVRMVLEHFDTRDRRNNIIVLSSFVFKPMSWWRTHYPKHRIVLYQLEQMHGSNTYHNSAHAAQNMVGADEVWDYDPLNIAWLDWHGIKVDRLVPLLYTRRLEIGALPESPPLDVVFLGLLVGRRLQIIEALQGPLYGRLRFSIVFGDDNMGYHVKNAKVVLNLHSFEPYNRQEQVRMFFPVLNGRTVVSEPSQFNVMEGEVIECTLDKLANTLLETCHSDLWKAFGHSARGHFFTRTKNLLAQWPDARQLD